MARLRDRLVGHGELWDQLVPSLQGPESAMTLLLAGPSGIGKKFFAMAAVQALLCERNSGACGQCPSCLRVEKGEHEGLLMIEPDGTQIKVDQARQVIEFLQLKSWSRHRCVIIDGAQALNPQAANSLLKVLEEPPPGTFLFLLAPSPSAVLPTLRSRSRTVFFRPLSRADLGRLQTAPDWAVRAARGSVERLRGLMDAEEQEVRNQAAVVLENFFAQKDFLSENSWREVFKERVQAQRIFSYWLGFLRDAWVWKAQANDLLMNPDQKKLLTALATLPTARLDDLGQRLLNLEKEFTFNRDPQLCMEELWVQTRV